MHACAAQPSAASDRVGSAQRGVWSLGLQGRVWGTSTCTHRTARKMKKRLEGEFEVVGGIVAGAQRTRKLRDAGEQEERSAVWSEGGREREAGEGGSEMKFEGQTFD